MNSMTLYVDRDSLVHKQLAPLTKALYVLVSIAVSYIIPSLTVALILTSISALILILGKVFRNILPVLALSILLVASVIIVQGFFHPENQTELFRIGAVVFYKEGLYYASLIAVRIINMIMAFGILIFTTAHDELVESMIKKGLSAKIGYVLLSVLQLIPQMSATMDKITDAQRSRGMETEGNLIVRMKAFFPLIGPVVLNSLSNTRERAIALEIRGFDSGIQKNFLNLAKEYHYQVAIQILLWLTLVLAIVWRVLA